MAYLSMKTQFGAGNRILSGEGFPAIAQRGPMTIRVLYLAHDLADPAIRRRVMMLRAGGADVMLAGFRRDENKLAAVEGVQPIELGITADGRFAHRAATVLKASLSAAAKLGHLPRPDVIIARNLEMLAIGRRARHIFGAAVPMVYECLDIHRLMLRNDPLGKSLRGLEARLGRQASLLITSSPAFVEQYFQPLSGLDLPTMLLENQVLDLSGQAAPLALAPRVPAPGQPWRIGWFGALRCSKSLKLLGEFTRSMQGSVIVEMRGRPAHIEFENFDAQVAREPYVNFHGPYKNPEDLAGIYQQVQFVWAIDFYEEGQNSSWLLPNRLYEGCRYGTVPIALKWTETARYLDRKGIGFELPDASVSSLVSLFETMTAERYRSAFDAVAAQDPHSFTLTRADCETLVRRLAALPADPVASRSLNSNALKAPLLSSKPTLTNKVDAHDG